VLLEALRSAWAAGGMQQQRFHHVPTDEVYGSLEPADPASTENSPYAPSSPYAASKAAADHLVRAYARTYGLPCTISNCSNNYGPYQFPEKLLPLCIVNMLQGRALPIYGDGLQIRDWLHVEDHCRAIDAILSASAAGETWNVGGAGGDSNLAVVQALCDLVDAESVGLENALRVIRAHPETQEVGIRVDSGVYQGWNVPFDYDPLLAKLIGYGTDRDQAISRLVSSRAIFIVFALNPDGAAADIAGGRFHQWLPAVRVARQGRASGGRGGPMAAHRLGGVASF